VEPQTRELLDLVPIAHLSIATGGLYVPVHDLHMFIHGALLQKG
jgi:hypothetical protein